MIKEWLASYKPKGRNEATAVLREIMQQVALAGLSRANFYEKAAFYGGAALRIFYGLDRFSEDLDFSLLAIDPGFSFKPYVDAIIDEFRSQAMDVSVRGRQVSIAGLRNRREVFDTAFFFLPQLFCIAIFVCGKNVRAAFPEMAKQCKRTGLVRYGVV